MSNSNIDIPVIHSDSWNKEVLGKCEGLQDVYGILKDHFSDRVLLTTDRPMGFTGYSNSLTGNQMHELGFKVTNALLSLNAISHPNDRIIVAKQNHADYFFYTHSIIRASGIAVVVNGKTRLPFISEVQNNCDAKVIITDCATMLRQGISPEVCKLTQRGVRFLLTDKDTTPVLEAYPSADVESLWMAIECAPTDVIPMRNFSDDSPLAIFHTSGTTGLPKLCIYDVRTARETWKPAAGFPLTAKSKRMSGLPCAHSIYFMAQTGAFLGGAWSYIPSKFDAKAWLTAMQDNKITYFLGFPYSYMRMAAEELSDYTLDSMQGWMSGGDTAHAAHIDKFKKFGKEAFSFHNIKIEKGSFFINPYGSTEIAGAGIYHFSLPDQSAKPCRVGKPSAGIGGNWLMKVVDKNNRELPKGDVGRIVLHGEYAPPGYWNRSDSWYTNRYDGWTWIGDVGYVDTDGFMHILDREVDTINTENGAVYSLAVEESILANDKVMEAAVVQRSTQKHAGGIVEAVALIVPRGYLKPEADKDWKALELEVRTDINKVFKPGVTSVRAVSLSELPLGCTGKLLKRTIREKLDEGWLSDRDEA